MDGPNGAGKSTTAPMLLKGTLGVTEFVNADVIAQGLSAFQPESAAFHAGRIMLERVRLPEGQDAWLFARSSLRNIEHWRTDIRSGVCLASIVGVTGILVHGLSDFNLQIPAAFRGLLARVVSPTAEIFVRTDLSAEQTLSTIADEVATGNVGRR
jgi:hypothetical protein